MASKRFMKRIFDDEKGTSSILSDAAIIKPTVSRQKPGTSEKRRLAALKTWEKRRMKQSKGNSAEAAVVTSMDKLITVSKVSPEIDAATCSTANKRSIAAYKTWEKRRAKQAAALAKTASIVPPIDDDQDSFPADEEGEESSHNTSSSNRVGGKALNKRSLAALKSWEKRRKKQGKPSLRPDVVSSAVEDASSADAEDEDNDEPGVSASGYVRKHKKGYTAELRSQAAKAAWERRKRLKEARIQSTAHDVTDTSEEDSATSKQTESKPKNKAAAKKRKRWDEVPESKRSNLRRTQQEVDGVDEAIKDANQVITRLKHSRNWMEFHPSSRYGNGTADYAYIPGSLAQLIRNGAFSKPIVLEHGTLGIHYALDYEGYGGLREMIETFGEDYAPCPSDKMMEASLEMQEKKETKVEQWDLGEDLPWQEVAEIEDARIDRLCAAKKKEFKAEPCEVDMPVDIKEVADILASLCEVGGPNVAVQDPSDTECSTSAAAAEQTMKCAQPVSESPTKSISKYSPALNALCGYDSESSSDEDHTSVDSESLIEEDSHQINSKAVSKKTEVEDKLDAMNATENSDTQTLYSSQSNQEEDQVFGVPLYSPALTAQYPVNEYNQEEDGSGIHGLPLSTQTTQQNNFSTSHQSSEDGILFIQDNRKIMLLAPPEEEEEEEED